MRVVLDRNRLSAKYFDKMVPTPAMSPKGERDGFNRVSMVNDEDEKKFSHSRDGLAGGTKKKKKR